MGEPVLKAPVRNAIEIAVYLLIIGALLVWCFRILSPFISFVAWGAVIAVAVYRPFARVRSALGGSNALAAIIFVLLGLAVVIVPSWMFAGSVIRGGQELNARLETGQFHVPPPSDRVKEWPLVGERLHSNWTAAADNMEGWLGEHAAQVKPALERVLAAAAGAGLGILQFIASTLIAGVMLVHDEATRLAFRRFFRRIAGNRGDEFLDLTTATIRSVAVGVLGVAFIQSFLAGAGMMFVGVPAAGIWALAILVLAIAQLPPLLVLLPVIIYVFATHDSTTAAVLFAVWSVLVSLSDAVLKPLMLGRGVKVPMLVILLGAIGGMIHSGIIGLFLGAVILALGYKLFQAWMEMPEAPTVDTGSGTE